jgi:cation transport regulator ChaC
LETPDENASDDRILQKFLVEEDLVAPGVPIVRASTPRPPSVAPFFPKKEQQAIYTTTSDFPIEAPAAPPLPEEYEDGEKGTFDGKASTSPSVAAEPSSEEVSEFIWLFAYGLEMDAAYLNSPDRLNGLAHFYGPAVLKGYQISGAVLHTGQIIATIAKSQTPGKEVWGVLYRIPRRLTEQNGEAPSILDNALATRPFKAVNVMAHETYRKRAVPCITYMALDIVQQEATLTETELLQLDLTFAQQLLELARRQKLPDAYLEELALHANHPTREPVTSTQLQGEQNTEPLPVIGKSALFEEPAHSPINGVLSTSPNGWLLGLSLYLVALFMATLTLAVMQALGYWNQVFSTNFTLLGAPWYMLIYGLLGGCTSCMMQLGRRSTSAIPGFVIVTWFTRPYLGALLAALAYLVLSSGLFILSAVPEQRYAFFSVVGAIAGLCEGWILSRQK